MNAAIYGYACIQASPVHKAILKNYLVVLKFTFIFIRGCKSIFGVAAAVIFAVKLASCFRNGWTGIAQPTRLHGIMLLCMR